MTRKKKNRTAAVATVSREVRSYDVCITTEMAVSKEEEKEKKLVVYGDRKVFVSFINKCKPVSWMEIDPHYSGALQTDDEIDDCFAVNRMPGTMNSPPYDLDVYRLRWLQTPVFDSKVFFIGGRFLDYDDFLSYGDNTNEYDWYFSTVIDSKHYELYSDKVFTYHLFSGIWEELSSRLNIARGNATVVIAGGVAYIIGGLIIDYTHRITTKEHWIECFNLLDDGKKNAAWEFLPATCAPPDAVFKDYMPMYTFVYELGNLIVFVMREAGCYAFNYVSKTWTPFHENINKHVTVRCDKVVVIDHLLFWHDLGFINAYDLKNDQVVLSHHLNQLKISMDVNKARSWAESILERVGNNTLLLICFDVGDVIGKKLHFYKFQIQNLSQVSYDNLGLNQIGCGRFSSSGILLRDVVAD